jgi:non-ribosomal peptide synthetase component F
MGKERTIHKLLRPHRGLFSRYAPASCLNFCIQITIVNTVHKHVASTPLSIGKPTPNNTVYILDEKMKPVPIGEPGIMWAGGAGITKGYVNLPELTAARYLRDPFMNDG